MTVAVSFAGHRPELDVPPSAHLIGDSRWRVKAIYERFLTSQTLPPEGIAVDIGAGFGAFAVPFALRYPQWTIWCFEPDADAYQALLKNIARHKLTNIIAKPFAVRGLESEPGEPLTAANADSRTTLTAFRRHKVNDGYLEASDIEDENFEPAQIMTLPASLLASLHPTLVKMTAPQAAVDILRDLAPAMPDWLIGEAWSDLPAALAKGIGKAAWVPIAHRPQHALRKQADVAGRADRLDVILPARQATATRLRTIAERVIDTDINVVVVSDQPEKLSELQDVSGLSVIAASNDTFATALGTGRHHSDARFIAMLSPDDLPDHGLFAALLNLARLSAAEICEGRAAYADALPRELLMPSLAERIAKRITTKITGKKPDQPRGEPSKLATSRARVYRRDFLDSNGLWHPEHLGGHGDLWFDLLARRYCTEIATLDTHGLLQQDRSPETGTAAFRVLEVCRLVLRRGIEEGWRDFGPTISRFADVILRAHNELPDALRHRFIEGAAELWICIEKSIGRDLEMNETHYLSGMDGFDDVYAALKERLKDQGPSYAWAWLDSPVMHSRIVEAEPKWDRFSGSGFKNPDH